MKKTLEGEGNPFRRGVQRGKPLPSLRDASPSKPPSSFPNFPEPGSAQSACQGMMYGGETVCDVDGWRGPRLRKVFVGWRGYRMEWVRLSRLVRGLRFVAF